MVKIGEDGDGVRTTNLKKFKKFVFKRCAIRDVNKTSNYILKVEGQKTNNNIES